MERERLNSHVPFLHIGMELFLRIVAWNHILSMDGFFFFLNAENYMAPAISSGPGQ